MSLPPPPIQVGNWDPVWKRWFQGLFGRVGGSTGRLVVVRDDGTSTATGLDEIEERLASIPERPDVAGLEARIAALEEQIASLTAPRIGDIESRIEDLERARASDTSGRQGDDDAEDLTT